MRVREASRRLLSLRVRMRYVARARLCTCVLPRAGRRLLGVALRVLSDCEHRWQTQPGRLGFPAEFAFAFRRAVNVRGDAAYTRPTDSFRFINTQ